MSAEGDDLRRQVEAAMQDNAGLLAAMREMLQAALAFLGPFRTDFDRNGERRPEPSPRIPA